MVILWLSTKRSETRSQNRSVSKNNELFSWNIENTKRKKIYENLWSCGNVVHALERIFVTYHDITCHHFPSVCLSDHRCLFAADQTGTRSCLEAVLICQTEIWDSKVLENASGALLCGVRKRKENVDRENVDCWTLKQNSQLNFLRW